MAHIRPLFSSPLSHVFDESRSPWGVLGDLEGILHDLSVGLSDGPYEADETDAAYVFTLPLPGFKKGDVDISVVGTQKLLITSQRGGGVRVWSSKALAGQLDRAIILPSDADSTKVEAKLEDGLLTVTVAKVAKPTPPAPRKVTVS